MKGAITVKETAKAKIFIDGTEVAMRDLIDLVGEVYARRYVVEGAQMCEYEKTDEIEYRYNGRIVTIRPVK